MAMTLTSTVFSNAGKIPAVYTCDGKNIPPDLEWSAVPVGTQSFALILDDPDAPSGVWTHWILFNIPANLTNLTSAKEGPKGSITGKNSWGKAQYSGPCPPYNSTHRYNFKLYAVDGTLNLPAGATIAEVTSALKQHILGQGELTGKYQRSH